jgi:HAD superfamily hydrolase (TIGR01509 family)
MSKLQALIFDMDGTMADTERDGHRVAFNRAFAKAGLDWDWSGELYGELLSVSGGKERMRHYVTHYQPDFIPSTDLDEFIADLHVSKSKYYQELLAERSIPLRLGVQRLLTEAQQQGLRLAIATTSSRPNSKALLESTLPPEAVAWFEVVAAGDMVPEKKPAPDIYNYVLQAMDLDPQDCLVFEDSANGLKASSQAGLKAVVTVNGDTQHQDFSEAVLVLDHLGEPQQPFTVLAGEAGNHSYVDVALARYLHEQNCAD